MTLLMAFTFSQKIFKKSYQFLKYTRAYLRKGRNAPELQSTRDKLSAQAHCGGTDETWTVLRAVCNRIKVVIGKANRAFLNTALSSKRPWVIHRDIHPSPRPFLPDPDQLNCYFIKTTD